jgi:hypothetical protein
VLAPQPTGGGVEIGGGMGSSQLHKKGGTITAAQLSSDAKEASAAWVRPKPSRNGLPS